MEKRGVSTIVATIVIILIMVSLVSMIVIFSNTFFDKNKDSTIIISPLYQKLKVIIDSATINPDETITIFIEREDNEGAEIPLKGIRFKFTDINSNSYTYDINDPPIEASTPKQYIISSTNLNIETMSDIKKLSVSGISPEGKQTVDLYEIQL